MSATWKPLPIWYSGGKIDAEAMARLRTMKLSMWLDYDVVPMIADEGDIERRVLAWGTPPPFLCAYALVDPLGTDRALGEGLAWVLHEGEYEAAMEIEDRLATIFGAKVREIPVEELESEERFARYQAGLD